MAGKSYSIRDIANWLLSKQAMTPKKLQKMLYYEYCWFLVFYNDSVDELDEKLFNDNFQAWVHGPVNYDIYKEFKYEGFNEIPKINDNFDNKFNPDILDSLQEVFDTYSIYNGNQLERLTHSELPWQEARDGILPLDRSTNVINDKTIYSYYSALANI